MQIVKKLIESFSPKNYNLNIKLDRINRKFSGKAQITGVSPLDTQVISFHASELSIDIVVVDGKQAIFEIEGDELKITNPNPTETDHIIDIIWNGEINDIMHGVYPCYYNHDGEKKEILATQFESHHAREVFPCIDEPAAKATFDLTLETEKDVTVLSNMPLINQEETDNNLISKFETTPKMSSYLLAFVVGELHKATAKTKSGIEVNVFSTKVFDPSCLDFALENSIKIIDFYEEYFGVKYPLPKSDQVALPDFASGAMENWGLVTYRETCLIVDEKETSLEDKRYVALVVAHELSHQWFGNLVTMEWWNDLWLNESFATFIEYLAIDKLYPDWNVWEDYSSRECIVSLMRDSIENVQPIQTEVNHPDEIHTLFDGAIVYAKGSRMINMIKNYVGEKSFRLALKNYFNKFAYSNTTANDLWNEFSIVTGEPIAEIMQTWISKPGFPVLSISKNNDEIELSQKKLISLSDEVTDDIWPIITNSNDPMMPKIITDRSITYKSNQESILLNVGNHCHFITNYDDSLFNSLINELKSNKLDAITRLQILNEQLILATAGIISNARLIELINSYKSETNDSVWDIIGLNISSIKKFVVDDEPRLNKLQKISYNLAIDLYKKLGLNLIPNEPEADVKLRPVIVGLMSFSEDEDFINEAFDLYTEVGIDGLAPNLRTIILSIVIRHKETKNIFDKLLNAYHTTEMAEIRNDIRNGLTSTKNDESITILLELIKDTSKVKTQDTLSWIRNLILNKYSHTAASDWMINNWEWIKSIFSKEKNYDDFVRVIASSIYKNDEFDQFKNFFIPKMSEPMLTRAIKMSLNQIENRIKLIAKDQTDVSLALDKIEV